MKKIVLLLLVMSSVSLAQDKLILGFDIGANFSGQRFNGLQPNIGVSNTPKFLGGLNVEYSFSEAWSIRAQCFEADHSTNYSTSYAMTEGPGTSSHPYIQTVTIPSNRSYFVIPVTAQYRFSFLPSFYTFAGPYLGIGRDDNSPSPDFGMTIGLGYSHELTRVLSFFFEGSYAAGFRNIQGNEMFYIPNGLKETGYGIANTSHISDLRISTGFKFAISLE